MVSTVVETGSDRVLELLSAELPATVNTVYLNAGTNGPIPNRVRQALEMALPGEVEQGRIGPGNWDGWWNTEQEIDDFVDATAEIAGQVGR